MKPIIKIAIMFLLNIYLYQERRVTNEYIGTIVLL